MERIDLIRPGLFSVQSAADGRRVEFDINNEIILMKKLPVKFVFIGDSVTHYWGLEAYFRQEDGLIVNRGISGETTKFLLKRFEADVLQLKPEYVVIKIGVNNTWVLEDFPWVQNTGSVQTEKIVQQIVEDITAMTRMTIKQGIKAAVCSILPTNMKWSTNNRKRNDIILETNKQLKVLTDLNNIIYVDYHSGLCADDGRTLRDGLSDDGIHPNVFGYEIMAEILVDTLAANGIGLKKVQYWKE